MLITKKHIAPGCNCDSARAPQLSTNREQAAASMSTARSIAAGRRDGNATFQDTREPIRRLNTPRPTSAGEPVIDAVIQVTNVMPATVGGTACLDHTDMSKSMAWTPVEFRSTNPSRYLGTSFAVGWIPGGLVHQNGWNFADQVRRGFPIPNPGETLRARLAPLTDRSFLILRLEPVKIVPKTIFPFTADPFNQCFALKNTQFLGRWRNQSSLSGVFPAQSFIDLVAATPSNDLGNAWDNVMTAKLRWSTAASTAPLSKTEPGPKLNWTFNPAFTANNLDFNDLPGSGTPDIGIVAGPLPMGVGGCTRIVFANGLSTGCGKPNPGTGSMKYVFNCLSDNRHMREIVMARVAVDSVRKYNDAQNKNSSENIMYALLHEFGHVLGLNDSPPCTGTGTPANNVISHTKSIMWQNPPPTPAETWSLWTSNFLLNQIDKDLVGYLYPQEEPSDVAKIC